MMIAKLFILALFFATDVVAASGLKSRHLQNEDEVVITPVVSLDVLKRSMEMEWKRSLSVAEVDLFLSPNATLPRSLTHSLTQQHTHTHSLPQAAYFHSEAVYFPGRLYFPCQKSSISLPKREDTAVFSLSDQYFPTKQGRYGCIFPVRISIFPMRQGKYQYFPYQTGKILVYSPQEQVFDRQIVYFKHGIY
jgi:hypothetical protein